MCVSIWRAVNVASGDLDPFGPQFSIGLFDCWAAHPFKQISMESNEISHLFAQFIKNIFRCGCVLFKFIEKSGSFHGIIL